MLVTQSRYILLSRHPPSLLDFGVPCLLLDIDDLHDLLFDSHLGLIPPIPRSVRYSTYPPHIRSDLLPFTRSFTVAFNLDFSTHRSRLVSKAPPSSSHLSSSSFHAVSLLFIMLFGFIQLDKQKNHHVPLYQKIPWGSNIPIFVSFLHLSHLSLCVYVF